MAKIKMDFYLKNKEKTIIKTMFGLLNKNKIVYYEENLKVTLFLETDIINIIRKNNDTTIDIRGNQNGELSCNYTIDNSTLKNNGKTIAYNFKENTIYFKYELNEDLFILDIKYEVMK